MSTTYLPFQLQCGTIETELSIPDDAETISKYFVLRDEFDITIINQPSTAAELLAIFMGFVSTYVNPDVPGGPYDLILKHILIEFRKSYLSEGLNIDQFALALTKRNFNSVAKARVQENLIKNYYVAVVHSNFVVSSAGPDVIHSGAIKTKYAVCYGQGNIHYFELLIKLHNWYGALINLDFLQLICAPLVTFVGGSSSSQYPQGFDVMNWLENPGQRPDLAYLLSAPVSCPLITLTQLAHYAVLCHTLGLTPGEYSKCLLAGTSGHSQGIVASLVIALSDSWVSFLQNSYRAVCLMLFVGTQIALKFPVAISPLLPETENQQNGEGNPTPMLMIRDLYLDQVQTFITQTNQHLPENHHIAISIYNGPTSFVVSGPPDSLFALVLILRQKQKGSLYEEIPYEGGFKISYEFLQVFAPLHSRLLKDSYKLITQYCTDASVEFFSEDIMIPLYDPHSGANLQDYDNTDQEYSLTSRIIKLITELPVHWETAARFKSENVVEFGAEDVFGISQKVSNRVEYTIFGGQQKGQMNTFRKSEQRDYAQFNGQGEPQYFELFLQVFEESKDLVYGELLVPIDARLRQLIQSNSSIASAYPHGLDFLNWLENPEQAPDEDYLLTASVSCPMITILQLAHYALQVREKSSTPGEFKKKFAGATGQSQGIVAAVVIALSDSWDSFLENSVKAVSLMLFIGSRTSLCYPLEIVPSEVIQDLLQNFEGWPSSTLKIRDLSLKQVENFITHTNEFLPEDERIEISHFSSPTSFGVTGPIESLYELILSLRKHRAEILDPGRKSNARGKTGSNLQKMHSSNNTEQETAQIPVPMQSFWFTFMDINAPFNSYLLKESYNMIAQDIVNAGIEFSVKDIQIPVYEAFNGNNLQEYDDTPQEYSLTSRLIRLVIELPIHWEAAVTNFDGLNANIYGADDQFEV